VALNRDGKDNLCWGVLLRTVSRVREQMSSSEPSEYDPDSRVGEQMSSSESEASEDENKTDERTKDKLSTKEKIFVFFPLHYSCIMLLETRIRYQ